jgi:hypothetical protein
MEKDSYLSYLQLFVPNLANIWDSFILRKVPYFGTNCKIKLKKE